MRLFLALDLNEEQISGLAGLQKELKKDCSRIKWVDSTSLHITIKFLGEIEENRINSLIRRVEFAIDKINPFMLSLEGLGFFPSNDKPRIIWVGIDKGSEHVKWIWEEIEWAFQEEGFSLSQKPFTPHVTVGRIRRETKKVPVNKWIDRYRDFSLPATKIDHITLYHSNLQPQGAVYTPLQKIIL